MADQPPFNNHLHGSVPLGWCKSNPTCNLSGVNSLCLPAGCPDNWCSLHHDCDVTNGHWSEWGAGCTTTCGSGINTRTCSDPSPKDGGKNCAGHSSRPCNTQPCPGLDGCCLVWSGLVWSGLVCYTRFYQAVYAFEYVYCSALLT